VSFSGCFHRKVIVSPYRDAEWLEMNQPAPHEGWLITQSEMDRIIEGWSPPEGE
tara:strand:+ start:1290 stop:1451 length:162 start_codon:yes stop_codon:yes gene_type:complete